ncbi:MoaD/ThiS family protein [Inmirania thermothiophila]|uniref:Sulfur carrier protein ThiS n=1 Tax=Inmirania thermothiophila TaxID=1750597 RepID=A0A3N1Y193_9GAMM|nr:MoaD/ThiS family protein [Inmirania thermothiophila]ROR32603.1 sulfur carrier protein ThiS [Inmirania thermothiophila]
MRITAKLYATLSDYLPAGARDHAVELEVPEGETVQAVLDRLRLPAALTHLVLVDGVFVPPEERGRRPLRAGETLAVWPPIAGG